MVNQRNSPQIDNTTNDLMKYPYSQSERSINDRCFTVVIPTYNRVHTIGRAIHSVLTQSYTNIELIIVDDGSTDGTDDLIARVDDQRLHYIWQENKGRCIARNVGAAQAQGDYITFLDSDDEAFSFWLESFVTHLEKAEIGLVSGGCEIYTLESSEKIVLPKPMGALYEDQQGRFLTGTFAVRKEIFIGAGCYAASLHHSENTELALRLIPYCIERDWKIASIQKPLLRYHYSQSHLRTKRQIRNRYESATFILERHKTRLQKVPASYATYCRVAAVNAMWLGKKREAFHYFLQAIRAHPMQRKQYLQLFSIFVPTVIHQTLFLDRGSTS